MAVVQEPWQFGWVNDSLRAAALPGADVGAFELAHQVRGQVALGNVDHYEHPLPVGADANVYVYKHHRVNVSLEVALFSFAGTGYK